MAIERLSLSFPQTARTGAAPVTAQPQMGAPQSFIKGVSMPGVVGAQETAASRVRGGGAGRDCLVGILGACVCSECCEGICDCIADILCCPCEMMGC